MKVKEIQKILNEMNPEATFILTNKGNACNNWEINYGGSEGVTKQNCDTVTLDVQPNRETPNSVFSREECVFNYCPHPNMCESKCQSV